jgi:hypothetical protein
MVQGNVAKQLCLLAVLGAALILGGCKRAPSAPGAAPSGTQAAAPGGAPAAAPAPGATANPESSPTAQAAAPGRTPAGVSASAPAPIPGVTQTLAPAAPGPSTASGRPTTARSLANASSLVAVARENRIYPEDFKLGPLGGAPTGSRDNDAAYAAAAGFLAAAVGGSMDAQDVTPDAKETIGETFAFAKDRGWTPTSWRLGVPKSVAGGQLAMNVRFFNATGTSEGEIYVSPAGSQWLVADLQVNLADLAVPRPQAPAKYYPSDYRWLLEE